MEENRAEEPKSRRRLRFEFRVTPYEDRFIREAAAALDMSITDYVLKRAVYSEERIDGVRTCEHADVPVCASEGVRDRAGAALSECAVAAMRGGGDARLSGCPAAQTGPGALLAANQELLRGILAELKAQGRNVNQIAKAASKIALDTRSRASIDLSKALKSMVVTLRPAMIDCMSAAADAIDGAYPRRR